MKFPSLKPKAKSSGFPMLDLIPPPSRQLRLTRQQKALVDWANDTVMQFSRELFANPQDASAIGEKYWDLFSAKNWIELVRDPEQAGFPGALTVVFRKGLELSDEIICLNPEALATYQSYTEWVTGVIMKPQLFGYEVVSREANVTKVKLVRLQNLHVFILPENEDDEEMDGLKRITFDVDYEYQMVDPATLDDYFNAATVHIEAEIKPDSLREKIGEVFGRMAQRFSHK